MSSLALQPSTPGPSPSQSTPFESTNSPRPVNASPATSPQSTDSTNNPLPVNASPATSPQSTGSLESTNSPLPVSASPATSPQSTGSLESTNSPLPVSASPVPSEAVVPPQTDSEPTPTPESTYDGGIQWKFGKHQQNSLRVLMWHQIWLRYNHTNPDTLVKGKAKDHQFDIGLRRSRVVFLARFNDRFLLVTHFGINNQSFVSARKPQLYLHDAWAEFRAWKQYLFIGAGLHIWSGISRLTGSSAITLLTGDIPVVNVPTVEATDQLARSLGVYAKGQIGPIDYRVSVNQPFAVTDDDGIPPAGQATFNPGATSVSVAGYAMWEFLDNESNVLPYYTSTYLGTKRVFNLGFGFYVQPDGAWDQAEDGSIREHDIVLLGADAFLDLPMPHGRGALTAYGVYYYYDLGPNAVRNIGLMNTGTSAEGATNPAGNAYPSIGSGHHAYMQAGYMFPHRRMGLHRLQPYASAQLSFLDAYDDLVFVPEGGINWYLLGHYTKLTLLYRNRPVFEPGTDGGKPVVRTRRSEALLQIQMYF